MNLAQRLVHWFDTANDTRGPEFDSLRSIVDDARRECCGALRKAEMVHGNYYRGFCCVASIARWNAQTQRFTIINYPLGQQHFETIRHMDDEVAECTHDEGFQPSDDLSEESIKRLIAEYPLEIK